MTRPNFFIVGAAKCGTTSMYNYLRNHPQIFMPDRKEPHFFAPDLRWRYDTRLADEAEYLDLFKDGGNVQRIGEASPFYLYSSAAAGLIKAFSPDARIIIMLRNPVDMIYSLHWHCVRDQNEDITDFAAALEAEEDRQHGRRIPKATQLIDMLFYRTIPLYAEQVRRYMDIFGRDRVLVIVFDDLKMNTPREYGRVTTFLEIDSGYQPEFVVANPAAGSGQPFAAFLRTHKRVHRVIEVMTPLSWRRAIGKTIQRYRRPPSPKPAIDPRILTELKAQFAPDVERLGRLLNRDLSHWSS